MSKFDLFRNHQIGMYTFSQYAYDCSKVKKKSWVYSVSLWKFREHLLNLTCIVIHLDLKL